MSRFYNPKRGSNIFNPHSPVPFRLSRSKIDLFLKCPRCFYLDRRIGIGQPPSMPYTLNSAVDKLLKKEFDIHRSKRKAHPLMETYGIDAIPFDHPNLNVWRDPFKGILYHHPATNFIITGGIDDVWINPQEELIIVDYKSTAKETEVNLDADWQIAYKRQMEIYQWLFRKNDFKVHTTGYFVYCNGNTDKKAFDGKLEFNVKIIPYEGDDSWIEDAVMKAGECLGSDKLPAAGKECDFCAYREAVRSVMKDKAGI